MTYNHPKGCLRAQSTSEPLRHTRVTVTTCAPNQIVGIYPHQMQRPHRGLPKVCPAVKSGGLSNKAELCLTGLSIMDYRIIVMIS